MSWKDKYVVVDTETTGLDEDARIVEIAIIGFEKGEIDSIWSTVLCPTGVDFNDPKVKAALAVNGLTPEGLENKRFEDVAVDVYCRLNGKTVVGHNLEFDLRMLRQEWKRLPEKGQVPVRRFDVCTLLCDFSLRPGFLKRNLAEACRRWGVLPGNTHRATADAVIAGRLLREMLVELPDDEAELLELLAIARSAWAEIMSVKR